MLRLILSAHLLTATDVVVWYMGRNMARMKVLQLPISALALIAQLLLLLSIAPFAAEAQPSGLTVSLAQLEQQLGAFPDYSKFAQVLQADDPLNTVLGSGESLYNKTVSAGNMSL